MFHLCSRGGDWGRSKYLVDPQGQTPGPQLLCPLVCDRPSPHMSTAVVVYKVWNCQISLSEIGRTNCLALKFLEVGRELSSLQGYDFHRSLTEFLDHRYPIQTPPVSLTFLFTRDLRIPCQHHTLRNTPPTPQKPMQQSTANHLTCFSRGKPGLHSGEVGCVLSLSVSTYGG